jgi:proteasome assembly chaperone (PAC2) family protein
VILYEKVPDPPLRSPVLVAAFAGWVNAGEAGTTAADFLAAGGEDLVEFDADRLFDFRDSRPIATFQEGVVGELEWPHVSIVRRQAGGRDLLVLTGTEPSLAWREFTAAVGDLATRFGVSETVVLGGIPWAAPHTRPVTLITTASASERLPAAADHPQGELTVPASIAAALDEPTIGFWARIPNYLGTVFSAGALALLERLALHLGVELDLSELVEAADRQRVHLDAITDGRSDIRTMVDQLEALVDAGTNASGEELAAEIERFLRNRGNGDFE